MGKNNKRVVSTNIVGDPAKTNADRSSIPVMRIISTFLIIAMFSGISIWGYGTFVHGGDFAKLLTILKLGERDTRLTSESSGGYIDDFNHRVVEDDLVEGHQSLVDRDISLGDIPNFSEAIRNEHLKKENSIHSKTSDRYEDSTGSSYKTKWTSFVDNAIGSLENIFDGSEAKKQSITVSTLKTVNGELIKSYQPVDQSSMSRCYTNLIVTYQETQTKWFPITVANSNNISEASTEGYKLVANNYASPQHESIHRYLYFYHYAMSIDEHTGASIPSSVGGVWVFDNDTNPSNGVSACSHSCDVKPKELLPFGTSPHMVTAWDSIVDVGNVFCASDSNIFQQPIGIIPKERQSRTRRRNHERHVINTDTFVPWIYLVLATATSVVGVGGVLAGWKVAETLVPVRNFFSIVFIHSVFLEALVGAYPHVLGNDSFCSYLLGFIVRINILDSRNLKGLLTAFHPVDGDYFHEILEMLIVPFVLSACVVVGHIGEVITHYAIYRKRDKFGNSLFSPMSSLLRMSLLLLVVQFFYLPLTMSRSALALTPCTSLITTASGESPSPIHVTGMDCSSTRFVLMQLTAFVCTFIVPVCVVASSAALLLHCRNSFKFVIDNPECTKDALLTYSGFLYKGYSSPNFFWGLINVVLMMACGVSRSLGWGLAIAILIVVDLSLHLLRKPLTCKSGERTYIVSSLVIIANAVLLMGNMASLSDYLDMIIFLLECAVMMLTISSVFGF